MPRPVVSWNSWNLLPGQKFSPIIKKRSAELAWSRSSMSANALPMSSMGSWIRTTGWLTRVWPLRGMYEILLWSSNLWFLVYETLILLHYINRIIFFTTFSFSRWLSLRLELIGNIVAFIAAILAVYGRDAWGIDPGTVGLSITYAVQVRTRTSPMSTARCVNC